VIISPLLLIIVLVILLLLLLLLMRILPLSRLRIVIAALPSRRLPWLVLASAVVLVVIIIDLRVINVSHSFRCIVLLLLMVLLLMLLLLLLVWRVGIVSDSLEPVSIASTIYAKSL
jgi:hypothetical protein